MSYNQSHELQSITWVTINHMSYNHSHELQSITWVTINHMSYNHSHELQWIIWVTTNYTNHNQLFKAWNGVASVSDSKLKTIKRIKTLCKMGDIVDSINNSYYGTLLIYLVLCNLTAIVAELLSTGFQQLFRLRSSMYRIMGTMNTISKLIRLISIIAVVVIYSWCIWWISWIMYHTNNTLSIITVHEANRGLHECNSND